MVKVFIIIVRTARRKNIIVTDLANAITAVQNYVNFKSTPKIAGGEVSCTIMDIGSVTTAAICIV